MMGRSASLVCGGMLALFAGSVFVSAQGLSSCVQVNSATYIPANSGPTPSELIFEMEGRTEVTANTVNVAVIIDTSGSVDGAEHDLEKAFAKNAVASFASRNLFDNGGMASFAQFATGVTEGGTFDSLGDFEIYVDNVDRIGGWTNISSGLAKGRELLNSFTSTASFLILITDGQWNAGENPKIEADAARDDGTIVYAVGVGSVPMATLEDIGGGPENVFDTSDFEGLDDALDDIISTSAGSIPCASSNAVVTVDFNGKVFNAVVDEGTASYAGNQAVFELPTLEATPALLKVELDVCGEVDGEQVVASVSYEDDEENEPDMSALFAVGVVSNEFCEDAGVTNLAAPVSAFSFSYSYSFADEPFYDDHDHDHDSSEDGLVTSPVPAPASVVSSPVLAPAPVVISPVPGPASIVTSPVPAPASVAPSGQPASATPPTFVVPPTCSCTCTDDEHVAPSPVAPIGSAPTASSPPPVDGTSKTGMTCSNGIYGVESDNGIVCCVAECGSCGGVGCAQFSPELGADECCVSEILNNGEACSVWGEAPCIIEGDSPVPSPTENIPTSLTSTAPTVHGPTPVAPVSPHEPGSPTDSAPTTHTDRDIPGPENDFEDDFEDDLDYSFSYAYEPTITAPPAPVAAVGTPVAVTESFTVAIPALDESSVDFGLLVDSTGSYSDDIANMKLLAEDLVKGLAANTADLALGLGSFKDISAIDPNAEYTLVKAFGTCSDDLCFEEEQEDFIAAVNTLSAGGGGDFEESQTIALVRAAEDWSWRDGVLKILAITTDALFHIGGAYFTLDEVIDACNAKNIKILALKAPGAGEEMDTIAEETGGVVATTSSDSADIVSAVLQGVADVQYSKVDVDWACEDTSWTLDVDPASGYDNVDGGASLDFTVTVSVPSGAAAGTTCTVNVLADEVLVGGQDFTNLPDGTVTVTVVAP